VAAKKASKEHGGGGNFLALLILGTCLLPIVIALAASLGGGCVQSCNRSLRPFPIACDSSDGNDIEVSGNWESTGPIVTGASGSSCKIIIRKSKLKASSFLPQHVSNVEIVIEDSTIETSDTMFHFASSNKLQVVNSVLTSTGGEVVWGNSSGPDIEATNSTFESKTSHAFRSTYGLVVHATNSKLRGAKSAFKTEGGFILSMKSGTQITGGEEPAIHSDATITIASEGAPNKISSASAAALVTTSGLSIGGVNLVISAPKGRGIDTTSGLHVDLKDSSITAGSEAIAASSGAELTLANVTVQGTVGLASDSGLVIKASKKSRLVGTKGSGVTTTSGAEITLAEAAIEGEAEAFKGTSGVRLRLSAGSRIAGRHGGIVCESSCSVLGENSGLEGGDRPAVHGTFGGELVVRSSVIKGTPALHFQRAPNPMDLTGTTVDGAQTITDRW
jgi:hypothetical protein